MTILEGCSPFIPLVLACWTLIGWGLQRVTSLRPAVAAKVLLLWNALRGLIRYKRLEQNILYPVIQNVQ